ncbi:uncharacterized protein LOC126888071 [Diabrotica virgifera virgifera]|uniref:DNA-directed DNA polymerase n=1 Tax=Diabrotica virgifera virgifera TaxID=50390 RepID=A0ABM5KPD3_DIAVI|nr:uncharacterized protein LOC126888071 [Diabrotica virgifera virgifera]
MNKFLVTKDTFKKIRKFGLQGRTLEFKIRDVPQSEEPVGWVKKAIEEIVLKGTEGLEPTDQVGFTFCSKDFARGQGWMRFKPACEVTVDDIWDKISSIYQSNSTGLNTETFCLGITTVKLPAGKGGPRGRAYNSFNEECLKRRGTVVIKNKDNLCLPRALVVAKAHVDKDQEWKKVRQDIGKIQGQRAHQLIEAANVTIPVGGAGIPELQQFQGHLTDYKIVVYSYGSKGRDVMFCGNTNGPALNLLYHEGHFNVITSLTAAFCCIYYCEECHQPFNNKNDHRCGGTCFACRRSPACSKDCVKIPCDQCGRNFYGKACFNAHLGSVCDKIKRCKTCYKIYTKSHVCGEVFCKTCKKNCPSDHLCYIQPDSGLPPSSDFLFIFYDLETSQEKILADGSLLQEPNLCVFNQRCYKCLPEMKLVFCQSCGFRQKILRGLDVISLFMNHILQIRKKFKNVVVLAHNGGGFDHQFILNYILTKTDLTPDLIMRGTKLVSMAVGNARFLDSLNYFPMALSALPKAFGLTELKKGYFPHLFNREENQSYVGPMPDLKFYDPDNLKDDARDKLIAWHAERVDEGYVFDFQKEIVEYCISDVEILTKACLTFRKQLMDTSNVCPFFEATTVASTCNKVFRRNFLQPNTIALIPKGGYRFKDNQSKIALQWLLWEEKQRCIKIQHAARGPEALIGNCRVDGLYENTIFDFQGCYYHGCPTCYPTDRTAPLHDDPSDCMENRHDKTIAKVKHLRSIGYEVVEIWECQFRKMLTAEIKAYTEGHPLMASLPLNPRDALYGGRTGNTVEYYKCKDGEKIKYVDVCSLYPWVCKYGKFPIGHPKKIYIGQECTAVDITELSGLIKCKVLPPTNLYHPVLPTKMNSKCMFVLCRKCGEDFAEEECEHSNDERALSGTWVIEEVVKALSKGYKIIETYEIWSYDTLQLSKSQKGLFSDMMNKFIKVKQQASGWPRGCVSDEEKSRYIEEFLQREDVRLEFSDITENPGLRSLAKLMLNSFWGKFAQRENLPKTSIINKPGEFFAMLINPSIQVNTVIPVNEDTLVVTWEYVEEAYSMSSTVNVVLASYVTALARLKLYSYLEIIGSRAKYYDTDSSIYLSKAGLPDLPIGECIGDLTDELGGGYISEFVSGGPKNYAYKYTLPNGEEKICCKVKGICLNYEASKLVNFDTIKKMVLMKSDPVSVVTKQIQRTQDHCVITKTLEKKYRPNSAKRKFFEDFTSVPYGYKKLKI